MLYRNVKTGAEIILNSKIISPDYVLVEDEKKKAAKEAPKKEPPKQEPIKEEVPVEQAGINSDVYTIDGKLVRKDATQSQVAALDSGLYIYQQKKMLVRK